MNHSVFVSVVLALLIPGMGRAGEWKEFTAKGEPFTILFPGNPTVTEKTTLTTTRHSADLDDSNGTSWGLAYTDYLLAPNPESLKSAQDQLSMTSRGRHLIAAESIEVNKYPGRDFSFTATKKDQKFHCWNRMILVKKRLYHLIVVSPDENLVREEDRKKFFDSFRLTTDPPKPD